MNTQSNVNDLDISIRVGMFNLQDGTNVAQIDEKTRCKVRSIVALVDETHHYALGMCPVKMMLPFSFSCLRVMTTEITSGREATKFILEEAAKRNVELPAAEFCVNYERSGIRKGEAFLPSFKEVQQMQKSALLEAWRKVGLHTGDRTFVCTGIGYDFNVWLQSFSSNVISGWYNQYRTFGVIPVVEIPL